MVSWSSDVLHHIVLTYLYTAKIRIIFDYNLF